MGCAMHKGPQPSEGPPSIRGAPAIWGALSNLKGLDNLRGPQQSEWPRQSEGPHQSERPTANWGAPAIRKAPAIWGALSNLKSPWQSEGPYQLERPLAIWGATAIWGCQQSEGPSAIEGLTPESCYHFAQAFVQCCQFGWKSVDGIWQPLWITLPAAASCCPELVRCGCSVTLGCNKRCTCVRSGLVCTAMCSCDSECHRDRVWLN